jgi:hypothetical protein
MIRKTVSCLICLALIFCSGCLTFASTNVTVGVTKGDVIEYRVTYSEGVPSEHDVDWAKIEVTNVVENNKIGVSITSTYNDGTEDTVNSTLNLETGQIGDCFIIPANLSRGDTFLDKNEGNITISGVEERTYAGSNRLVVLGETLHTKFYWDQATGILVEATSYYSDFTLTTLAEKTNIWQTQTSGIDPLLSVILMALVIVLIIVVIIRRKMQTRK